jgi:uncharacterized membrane protein YphA (DoxX/SURF4 family)
MNTLLWILQGMVAGTFAMTGFMKLSKSRHDLKKQGGGRMDWIHDVSGGNLKLIGTLEVLAAIGIIVPHLTGILPWLTPLAALGIICIMVGAMILHVRRRDGKHAIIPTAIILLIAAFLTYGRSVLVP